MAYLRLWLFFILFGCICQYGIAQQANSTDSTALNEAMLMKDEQQKKIDSIVREQLQRELAAVSGNAKRTEELEAQLHRIAVNDSLRTISQLEKLREMKKTTKGYPVLLLHDTLFYIYTKIGSFSAKDRAIAVAGKVEKLYDDPFFEPDSMTVVENEGAWDIVYSSDEVILSIDNLDGLWMGKSNETLAREYAKIIVDNLVKEREIHSFAHLLKRLGLVALIFTLLIVIVVIVNKIFSRSAGMIMTKKNWYQHGLRLRNVQVITANHLKFVLLRLNMLVKIVVILLVIYLSLPLLFSIFPETEALTDTLLDWILSPLRSATRAVISYLPNLFKILIIYLVFKYLLRAVRYFFYEIEKGNIQPGGFHADWAIPTFNILRFILYAFMLVLVFPFLPGSGSPAFQGVSVFLGILISLGSSSAISNIVAGLVITYMRPFKVGDRVKIGDIVGDVMEKSMLVTRIKTIKNEDITVPNSAVLSSSTTNYSSYAKPEKDGLIIHYTVTIGYDIPWQQVYELLIMAAGRTEHLLQDPKPFVLQTSLDDFYISYQVNAYTREAGKQALIYSQLLEQIQNVFKEAGIELMSPAYTVIRDGGKE
jgi:small-conductance mechanosensitive channel